MRNLFLAITLLVFSASFAQKGKMKEFSPSEKTQKFIKRWTKELTLTEAQQNKANPIVLDMFTKIAKYRNDTNMTVSSRNLAIKGMRKIGLDNFRGILTPEQAVLFDKKMEELAAKGRMAKSKEAEKREKKGLKEAAEDELDNENIF